MVVVFSRVEPHCIAISVKKGTSSNQKDGSHYADTDPDGDVLVVC